MALSASTGEILWSRPVNYRTRPVVIGDRIIIEPRACDLRTGKIQMRKVGKRGAQMRIDFDQAGVSALVMPATPKDEGASQGAA